MSVFPWYCELHKINGRRSLDRVSARVQALDWTDIFYTLPST